MELNGEKSRSKETVETPAEEIQVLVGKEEKVVSGVTKHTTCSDIVHALLEDHKTIPESKRLLHGEPKEFCLLERWKGFERALPPLTRILRLWNAWGDERPFIQFVLVKTSDFVPKRSSKSKGLRSKRWDQGAGQYARNLPVEQQKRMVKKAFRKLEKMQKARSLDGLEDIDKMVQLIISQDCTIRQQLHQIKELDMELELVDQQMRESSVPNSGLTDHSNVQLLSLSEFQSEDQLQEYLYTSDVIAQLDQQVLRHNELINVLSKDIDLELRKAICELDSEPRGATAADPTLDFNQLSALSSEESLELVTLQSELEESMRAGISLHTQTLDLEKELQQNTALLQSRNQEYQHLIAQMKAMQLEECAEPFNPVYLKNPVSLVSQNTTGMMRPKLLPGDMTDTDSDTGISSTHSQDSLSPCVDSLPPLDTDV
ncbi:Ras association domain-containing protein 9 [Bagarius yarrelli]|uniref:Ras association domain-containing protein 9 n=1 Tax=Bagarius yarrelli TaxID=175774 RepID=A0A556TQX1_BAGYA|nr:Ras association domain-containing protein 9 [Bagarius yarrelli]